MEVQDIWQFYSGVSLVPRPFEGRRKGAGTHCLRMLRSPKSLQAIAKDKRTGEEADYVASFVTERPSSTAVRESDFLALLLNIRSVMIV